MKFFLLASLTVLIVVENNVVDSKPESKYTTKYDNIDIDEILHSDRLLKNYVACLKGSGHCTPDGSELKRYLPDALESECSKCSDTQREKADKVISYLINERPDFWTELKSVYDPTGEYTEKYLEKNPKAKG